METHAHDLHKAPGHGWKHYFFEFMMLFLAVFCGFLAENMRENMVEHHREQEYMASMLEDLKSDTARLNETINYWDNINISIDSLAESIRFPAATTDFNKAYRHLNNALNYYSFLYNERTVAQLKNAGAFRLIRKKNVANKIISYDQFNNDAIKNIAYQHNKFYENVTLLRNKVFSQDIINKIYDRYQHALPPASANAWIDSLISKNKSPFASDMQTALLYEFKNTLLAYRNDFSNILWGNKLLMVYQKELIRLLNDEYQVQ